MLISPCMHYLSTNKTLIKKQSGKKWLSSKHCHFVKKYFYGNKLLHANVQCVYIVYAKYQMASVKTLVQVDFPVQKYYLSTNKTLIKKQCKKMAKFKTLSFCQRVFLWHQTSSCKCPMCLHCVYKVSGCFSKSCGTS